MKRITGKIIKERGWAVLVITTMLLILLTVSTFDIVLVNVRQVKDADIYTAINNGEKVAIATASPIKRKITETLYPVIKKKLDDRMTEIVSASGGSTGGGPPKGGSSLPTGGINNTGVPRTTCITSIDPTATIEQQYSICDPMTLLDDLQGLKFQKQTIDFFSAMKPKQTKAQSGNPDYDYQLRELERESFNEFDYQLTTTFVGVDIMSPGGSGRARVELYRYLVTADVEVHTYADVYNQIRIDYDVVVQVGARGGVNVSPCGLQAFNIRGNLSFLMGYMTCTNPATQTGCKLVPNNSPQFDLECDSLCQQALEKMLNGTPFGGLTPAEQAAVGDKLPEGEVREVSGTGGCTSGGTGTVPNTHRNLYRWDIVVRPVGMGHNYY